MSAGLSAFMKEQMADMMQEMDSEFSGDNEEQNTVGPEMYNDDTAEDEMSTTRSQSLSADFKRLTIEEPASSASSRSAALIYGSSSTVIRTDKSPRHIIIPGDHIEVDDNFYQSDFDSHRVKNNIIENSFREGDQKDIGVWRMLGMFICVP